uniref:COP9 signalosome complex subunit 3 n=1 Tax=Daphnia longispina TaxID=42846 RepID=A0A4Y7M3Q6_9CRUS|nr:EOG090X04TU [Daphnia longispina]
MASSLEHFVNSVRNLSGEGSWRELYDFLGKSPDVLMRNSEHLSTVLDTLDPQLHSLGVLAIYMVKFIILNQNAAQNQGIQVPEPEVLIHQVSQFITVCNGEQIRCAPDSFAELCNQFTQCLVEKEMPARGIVPLTKAIRKARMNETQLTSIHANLLQLCLMSQNLKPALEFLNVDISEINPENGYFDAKHFLLYYYYGGVINMAVKNFERALYSFEVALTTPSSAVSHIMLESYKKYILVSLILHGKVAPLPKYTSQVVNRLLKPMSAIYHEITTVFATNKPTSLELVLQKHRELLQRENNWGLAKQVQQSLYKKIIQRLTQTFLTLSLSDMALRVQLPSVIEAEKLVLTMIEDGDIYASISQKDGMVLFHDNPDKYDSTSTVERVQKEVNICIELDMQVQKMEEAICTNPVFVKKASGAMDEDDGGRSSASSALQAGAATKVPSFSM